MFSKYGVLHTSTCAGEAHPWTRLSGTRSGTKHSHSSSRLMSAYGHLVLNIAQNTRLRDTGINTKRRTEPHVHVHITNTPQPENLKTFHIYQQANQGRTRSQQGPPVLFTRSG